jgi:hypothetical protein
VHVAVFLSCLQASVSWLQASASSADRGAGGLVQLPRREDDRVRLMNGALGVANCGCELRL